MAQSEVEVEQTALYLAWELLFLGEKRAALLPHPEVLRPVSPEEFLGAKVRMAKLTSSYPVFE